MEIKCTIYNNNIEIIKEVKRDTVIDDESNEVELLIYENTIYIRGIAWDLYDKHYFAYCHIINTNNIDIGSAQYYYMKYFKEKYPHNSCIGYTVVSHKINTISNIVEEIKDGRIEISFYVFVDDKNYEEVLKLIRNTNSKNVELSFNYENTRPKEGEGNTIFPLSTFNIKIKTMEIAKLEEEYLLHNLKEDRC